VPAAKNPSELHRVFEEGKPKFQLRKGEEGLSVFDADELLEHEILPNFRPGSRLATQQCAFIEGFGLKVEKADGDPSLPQKLREHHWEIRPGERMTRHQFKTALKKLEAAVKE
jgi:hypothetical protein